jgi:hypothetical protein
MSRVKIKFRAQRRFGTTLTQLLESCTQETGPHRSRPSESWTSALDAAQRYTEQALRFCLYDRNTFRSPNSGINPIDYSES